MTDRSEGWIIQGKFDDSSEWEDIRSVVYSTKREAKKALREAHEIGLLECYEYSRVTPA